MSGPRASDALLAVSAEHTARLSALFDAHEERLYRLARRLTANVDDALDLVQETFLKAARSPHSIPHGLRDEEAWLVRILVNVRRDQWRREKIRKRHDRALNPAAIQDDDPETSFVIRTVVWRALDYLPPRRRAVVTMHEIEGLDTKSIAFLLGISAITVRWHLAQGRRDLARRLKFQLGDCDETPHQPFAGRRPAPSRPPAP
jgi:RNA polymerase sigma-70 factor (ECF subfamily)